MGHLILVLLDGRMGLTADVSPQQVSVTKLGYTHLLCKLQHADPGVDLGLPQDG